MINYLENLRVKIIKNSVKNYNKVKLDEPVYNYMQYRIKKISDLDGCEESKAFYKKYSKLDNFRGETLTSAQTFINSILFKNLERINKELNLTGRKKWRNIGIKGCKELYKYKESLFNELLFESKRIEELLMLCHTLANFSYVPVCFNAERSGHYADWDNWNTTLFFIKRWYNNNFEKKINISMVDLEQDKDLIDLMDRSYSQYNPHPAKVFSIIYTKEWLAKYENFNKFCESNFFNCFLDENRNVKELYKGQLYENDGSEKIYGGNESNYGFITIPSDSTIDIIDLIIGNVINIIKLRAGEIERSIKQ